MLSPPPLRTARESFDSSRSSLSDALLGTRFRHSQTKAVNLPVANRMIDQIQQLSGGLFGRIWKKLGTKAKLWAMMRSLFSVLGFDSMKDLYRHLAGLYQLQLE